MAMQKLDFEFNGNSTREKSLGKCEYTYMCRYSLRFN